MTQPARQLTDSGVHLVRTSSRRRKPKQSRRPKSIPGVVTSVRTACKRKNALATACGAVLGGFVPVAGYFVAHREAGIAGAHQIAMLITVLGCLLFSAKTVWQWAWLSFRDSWKATGFVIALEIVMTLSTIHALAIAALVLLTGINAIATGVTLSRN